MFVHGLKQKKSELVTEIHEMKPMIKELKGVHIDQQLFMKMRLLLHFVHWLEHVVVVLATPAKKSEKAFCPLLRPHSVETCSV